MCTYLIHICLCLYFLMVCWVPQQPTVCYYPEYPRVLPVFHLRLQSDSVLLNVKLLGPQPPHIPTCYTCLCLGCPRHPGALCGTARPGNVFDCWIQPPPFGFKVRMIGETGAWGIEKQGHIKNIQKWSNNCLHPDNKCAAKMMQAGYNDGIGQRSSHSYA